MLRAGRGYSGTAATALAPFPASTRNDAAQSAFQWDDVNTGAKFDYAEVYNGWTVYVSEANFGNIGFDPNIPGATTHM